MRVVLLLIFISGFFCSVGSYAQGSLIITLEVAQDQLLYKWSGQSIDTLFIHAISDARHVLHSVGTDDYITRFSGAYKASASKVKLCNIFSRAAILKKSITATSSDAEVVAILHHAIDSMIDRSATILQRRLDSAGGKSTAVRKGDQIIIEITDSIFPYRARRGVFTTGTLELWQTYENADIFPLLMKVNDVIAQQPWYKKQTAGNSDPLAASRPLSSILYPAIDAGKLSPGPTVGYARAADTAQVNIYLGLYAVSSILPRPVHFLWSAKPFGDGTMFMLYAIKADSATLDASVTAGQITDAHMLTDDRGQPTFSFTMNSEGSKIFASITKAAAHLGTGDHPAYGSIAVVVDGEVISAPSVRSSITGGKVDISGLGSAEHIQEMARIIRAGALPARVYIVEERVSSIR